MLALLVGCGLRRGELLALQVESIQLREEHWIIADPLGKAGHIRTLPVPAWVKAAIDEWKEASGINQGALWLNGLTPRRFGGPGYWARSPSQENAVNRFG
jgi:integrase